MRERSAITHRARSITLVTTALATLLALNYGVPPMSTAAAPVLPGSTMLPPYHGHFGHSSITYHSGCGSVTNLPRQSFNFSSGNLTQYSSALARDCRGGVSGGIYSTGMDDTVWVDLLTRAGVRTVDVSVSYVARVTFVFVTGHCALNRSALSTNCDLAAAYNVTVSEFVEDLTNGSHLAFVGPRARMVGMGNVTGCSGGTCYNSTGGFAHNGTPGTVRTARTILLTAHLSSAMVPGHRYALALSVWTAIGATILLYSATEVGARVGVTLDLSGPGDGLALNSIRER